MDQMLSGNRVAFAIAQALILFSRPAYRELPVPALVDEPVTDGQVDWFRSFVSEWSVHWQLRGPDRNLDGRAREEELRKSRKHALTSIKREFDKWDGRDPGLFVQETAHKLQTADGPGVVREGTQALSLVSKLCFFRWPTEFAIYDRFSRAGMHRITSEHYDGNYPAYQTAFEGLAANREVAAAIEKEKKRAKAFAIEGLKLSEDFFESAAFDRKVLDNLLQIHGGRWLGG